VKAQGSSKALYELLHGAYTAIAQLLQGSSTALARLLQSSSTALPTLSQDLEPHGQSGSRDRLHARKSSNVVPVPKEVMHNNVDNLAIAVMVGPWKQRRQRCVQNIESSRRNSMKGLCVFAPLATRRCSGMEG